MRLAQRDLYVSSAFTPIPALDVFEWYRRLQGLDVGVVGRIDFLTREGVSYFVATSSDPHYGVNIAWSNSAYVVYGLEGSPSR